MASLVRLSFLAAILTVAAWLPASASAELVFRTGPGLRADTYGGEVVHLSSDGNLMLKTSASDDEGLALLDISEIEDPTRLAGIDFQDEMLGLTSATFSADDRFILCVYSDDGTAPGTTLGQLVVIERKGSDLSVVRRIALPAQPDSIEVSEDGEYAAIAIEDEDKILPGGQMEILHLTDQDDPATWTLHDVPLVLDATYAENTQPQPEYVDFNADNEVAVSIQEQAAIAIIDAPAAVAGEPAVETIFHSGDTNFPDDSILNDSRFDWSGTATTVARQDDAVAWTADGQAIAAVAEGETTDPHEWTIYGRTGNVIYASGSALNRNNALYGQHPVNFKGTQPEGLTIETYKGREYAFMVMERTAAMSVYDLTDSLANPVLVGVYPTGTRPETVAFSVDRGIAVTGNETDDSDPSSTLIAMDRSETNRDKPLLKGDEPWANMRGLAALSTTKLLAVSSDVPHKLRQIDLSKRGDAAMSTLAALPAPADVLAQVVEDVVADGQGGTWVTTTSAGLIHIPASGPATTVPSPVTTPTGIALTKDGESLIVINASGQAGRVPVAGGAATTFTVTTTVAGQFTDLATAPDGSIVAIRANTYNTATGAGETALVSFPASVAAGQSVAATTVRAIGNAEQSQYASERLTALAISPNGDVWFAHGASLNGSNGTDPGLRRIAGVFAPAPPVPGPELLPSSNPTQPLAGLSYMQAGGDLYATAFPDRVIAPRVDSHGPNAAVISPQTGLTKGLPNLSVNSPVNGASSDGAGGFYIAGNFTQVNGEPAVKVAHVKADGSLDHSFVAPTLDGPETGLLGVAFAGGRVWIAGGFEHVNGVTRQKIAALHPDGSLDQSIDIPANAFVNFFRLVGGKIYVGGNSDTFTLGGQLRPRMGRIDPVTATVDSFAPAPNITIDRAVNDVAVDGNKVILGGTFTTLAGQPASCLAVVDGTTGALIQDLKAKLTGNNPQVLSVAVKDRQLWVGGLFGTLNGVTAPNLGAIDLDNPANVTAFPAGQGPNSTVTLVSALADGGILVAGGVPDSFLATNRGLAVFDPTTLTRRASFVGSQAGSPKQAIQLDANRVLITGQIGIVGEKGPTRQLSRVDPVSGKLDPGFNPPANLKPWTIAADGQFLYLATGQRLDRQTGELDPTWSFDTNLGTETSTVRMLVHDSRLFLFGGSAGSIPTLRQINGVAREGIGAVDRETGEVTPFNTAADSPVTAALITPEGRMFVAGEFTKLAGKAAGHIAEVDPVTGALLHTFDGVSISKQSTETSIRHTLAYDPVGKDLYVGNVRAVNGQAAGGLVAFDVSGSTATRLPEFDPVVIGTTQEAIVWAAGGLIVRGNGTVNGTPVPASAFRLTPAGDLDTGFLPASAEVCEASGTQLLSNCGVEVSAFGSRITINGQVYQPAAPTSTVAPAVSGALQDGAQLTCERGQWDAGPTSFAYQWVRDGSDLLGATAPTFTPSEGDVGHLLSCEVTATNQLGSATAASAAVTIGAGAPGNSAPPTISGTPLAGQTLTATTGTWTKAPDSFSYQWLRDGAPIDLATAATHLVSSDDSGHQISVRVVATNAKGSSSPATSTALRIATIPTNSVAPSIAGSAAVGETLTASAGNWTGFPDSYAYQWLRDGTSIVGATGPTFVPSETDQGHQISVRVTATSLAGNSAPATSGALQVALPAAPVNVTRPLVSGPGIVGGSLACSPGVWTGAQLEPYAYRWLRSGDPVSTATTYVLSGEDVGRSISCEVTASNPGGETSAESAAIDPQLPVPAQPAPVIVLPAPAPEVPVTKKPAKKCKKGKVSRKGKCVVKGGKKKGA